MKISKQTSFHLLTSLLEASHSVDKSKLSQIKLDPLSVEKGSGHQKSPRNLAVKKSIEVSAKHLIANTAAGFNFNRPNSEELATGNISNKILSSKQVLLPNLKSKNKNKGPSFIQTLQPTRTEKLDDHTSPSAKESRIKQKFKSAQKTEKDLQQQIVPHPDEPLIKKSSISESKDDLRANKKILLQARKYDSLATYEQKMRNLRLDESDKNDADETIKEMLPESSFITLHSSRVKKTHSTHLSLSTSGSKDSDFQGTKSFSVEGHGRSSEDKSLKTNWQPKLNSIREKENNEEKETNESENKNESNQDSSSQKQPPRLFGKKNANTGNRQYFFFSLKNKAQQPLIPVKPEEVEHVPAINLNRPTNSGSGPRQIIPIPGQRPSFMGNHNNTPIKAFKEEEKKEENVGEKPKEEKEIDKENVGNNEPKLSSRKDSREDKRTNMLPMMGQRSSTGRKESFNSVRRVDFVDL
jgi:hypothetical protein